MPFGLGGPTATLGPGGNAGGVAPSLAGLPTVQAVVGTVSLPSDQTATTSRSASAAPALFPAKPAGPAIVTVSAVKTSAGDVVAFMAGLRIDVDGAGGWSVLNPNGRTTTSLTYPGGASLDPGKIPYIVVSQDFLKKYPGVGLGDYAAVSYKQKTLYAIIGDVSKKSPALGEGSLILANSLGVNPDPKASAVASGVRYVILAGTHDTPPPSDAATIETRGTALFQRAGLAPH
ncbi:MAG: hypothetical protein HKL90_15440 [Elusimicrobia bacterium]|nr:hypothetical protein [Elusimicrobiota bacterium]